MTDTIRGALDEIEYRSPSGKHLLRVRTRNDQTIRAWAQIDGVYVGERIVLTGNWSRHQSPGRVFLVDTAETRAPESSRGLSDYIARGLGVSLDLAHSIEAHFGDRALEIMDTEFERLAEIPGIDKESLDVLGQNWSQFRRRSAAQNILDQMGLQDIQVDALTRLYGNDMAVLTAKLREDPYLPYLLLDDASFKRIDEYAARNKISPVAPVRLRAVLMAQQRQTARNGHTYCPRPLLLRRALRMARSGNDNSEIREAIETELDYLIEAGYLAQVGERVYLPHLKECELRILSALVRLETAEPEFDAPPEIAGVNRALGVAGKEALPQRFEAAVMHALSNKVSLIDCACGTQRLELTDAIARSAGCLGLDWRVLTATGAQADRLNELQPNLNAEATSDALGVDSQGVPRHDPSNPLQADFIVVFGAEQFDVRQVRTLLDGLGDSVTLALVGDADYNARLGPGHPYKDLYETGRLPSVSVSPGNGSTPVGAFAQWRQDPEKARAAVNRPESAITLLHAKSPDQVMKVVRRVITEVAPALSLGDTQVIVPTMGVKPSVEQLAEPVRELDCEGRAVQVGARSYRKGERLIAIDSVPEQGLTVGRLLRVVTAGDGRLMCQTAAGAHVALTAVQADTCVFPASVIGVYMALGNLYDAVVLVVPDGMRENLAHEGMFYAAACCARTHLFVIGDSELFIKGLSRDRLKTFSGLAEQIAEAGTQTSLPEAP